MTAIRLQRALYSGSEMEKKVPAMGVVYSGSGLRTTGSEITRVSVVSDCKPAGHSRNTSTASDLSDASTADMEDRMGVVARRRFWANCAVCSNMFNQNSNSDAAETSLLFARHYTDSSVAMGVCDDCYERMVANRRAQRRIVENARSRAATSTVYTGARRCTDSELATFAFDDAPGGDGWATAMEHQTDTAMLADDDLVPDSAACIPAVLSRANQPSSASVGIAGSVQTAALPPKKRKSKMVPCRAQSDGDADGVLVGYGGPKGARGTQSALTVVKPPVTTRNRFSLLTV